jgi:hypothetical protein
MPFSVSPSVTVTEVDQSSIIPQVATTVGAFVGRFDAGPVNEIVEISSEQELFATFGSPNAGERGTDWWVCANFLNYSDKLKVVRVDENDGTSNEYTTIGYAGSTAAVPGGVSAFYGVITGGMTLDGSVNARVEFKEPGPVGNSLRLVVWAGGSGSVDPTATRAEGHNGHSEGIEFYLNDAGLFTYAPTTTEKVFESYSAGILAGGDSTGNTADEVHIALIDHKGLVNYDQGFTGTVLEKWEGLSQWRGVQDNTGKNLYYKDVINEESQYIKIEEDVHRSIFSGHTAGTIGAATGGDPLWSPTSTAVPFYHGSDPSRNVGFSGPPWSRNASFFGAVGAAGVTFPYEGGGSDSGYAGLNPHVAAINKAYDDHFSNADEVDIDLLIGGAAESVISGKLVDIAESRKDCVAFISPPASPAGTEYNDVVYQTELKGYSGSDNIINYRNSNNLNSSYAVMDSGWKYQFDSYNGIFRWLPLNADTAGLCARTENEVAPWFSPAGLNRGRVQGVVKLAINPSKADRDKLYQAGINPVVSFPGEGAVLFGDKTLQRRPSALDRINVRRLMIFLEKAISTAAKFQLFEFNDTFSRRAFVSTITPFLRRVQSQRGITDFRVVCDETNNTDDIVSGNKFVADIFIKPAISTNFINLNFVALRQDAVFTETTS